MEVKNKKKCIVKINIINDEPFYIIKSNKKNINKINLLFYIGKLHIISDLLFLTHMIKKTFKCNEYYNIIFDFKNCPKTVKDLKDFQYNIKEIFQVNKSNICNTDNVYTLSNIVFSHSIQHGKHPNFFNYENPIIFNKLKNYINNILNYCYNDDVIMTIIINVLEHM